MCLSFHYFDAQQKHILKYHVRCACQLTRFVGMLQSELRFSLALYSFSQYPERRAVGPALAT